MGDVQGWITIGTRLDSKQLEKQLKQQKRELNQYAKEEEKLLSQKDKNDKKIQQMKEEAKLLDQQRREDLRKAKFESDESTRNYKRNEAISTYNNEMAKLDQKYAENINSEEEISQKIDVNRQKQKMLNDEVSKTTEELKKAKIDSLPGTLLEAIELLEKDEVVKDALGEHIHNEFVTAKNIEWDKYIEEE